MITRFFRRMGELFGLIATGYDSLPTACARIWRSPVASLSDEQRKRIAKP